jgi:phosphatidate phosphatase APP1
VYDLVTAFLRVQNIPAGPLFLRAWGFDADPLPSGGHRGHKSDLIIGLPGTCPEIPFVLIGDSGQEDPEIYRDIALGAPGRVLAVYIRDVTTPERDGEVQAIAEQVREAGVPFSLVSDTAEAARHPAELGLIMPGSLGEVAAAVGFSDSSSLGG